MIAEAPTSTTAADELTPAQRLVILKSYIGIKLGAVDLADAFTARLRALLPRDELDYAAARGWLFRPQSPIVMTIDQAWGEVRILACAFDKPDALGRTFSAATKFHTQHIQSPMLLFNHGLGPKGEPGPGGPDIIGRITRRYVDQVGVWYMAKLDRRHELAQRVWEAATIGTARASAGTIANIERTEADGQTSHFLVAEVSLFDVPDRAAPQPAHPWCVVLPATIKLAPMLGEVPSAWAWTIERKLDCDPQLQHLRAQLAQFVVPTKEPS